MLLKVELYALPSSPLSRINHNETSVGSEYTLYGSGLLIGSNVHAK